jgi:hypothetical protein
MEMSKISPESSFDQTELFPTASWAASPAKTSARWADALELTARSRAYGASSPGLLAKFDPASSSWKTPQSSLDEGLATFSGTWPDSGMMRSGTAYQLPTLALVTDETGLGLFPTPLASETGFPPLQVPAGRHQLVNVPGREAEPGLGRVADELPDQAHRLGALGNAVDTGIPELIGRVWNEAA